MTLDYWTGVNGKKFLAVTLTFHCTDDEWNVQSHTLQLIPVAGSATGIMTKTVVVDRIDALFRNPGLWG